MQLVKDNQVLVVIGETGSGKTTQVRWMGQGWLDGGLTRSMVAAVVGSLAAHPSSTNDRVLKPLNVDLICLQIPRFLYEAGLAKGGAVACTQPRRVVSALGVAAGGGGGIEGDGWPPIDRRANPAHA